MNANYLRRRGVMSSPHVAEAHGSIASFDSDYCARLKDLTIGIEPVQDLHGYDNPWPAGGGVNKFACGDAVGIVGIGSYGLTIDVNATSETIRIHGTPNWSSTGTTSKSFRLLSVKQNGSYGNAPATHDYSGLSFKGFIVSNNGTIDSIQSFYYNNNEGTIAITVNVADLSATVDTTIKLVAYSGSTAPTSWTPYSNICPITGWTGGDVVRCGKNLYKQALNGYYLDTVSGLPVEASGYEVSEYIPVMENTPVYIPASGSARRWFYDVNKNPKVYLNNSNNQVYTPTENGYIRVTLAKTASTYETYQIEYGSTGTSYEPYTSTTIPLTWQTEAGTVYGGTVDVSSGVLRVEAILQKFDNVGEDGNIYSTPKRDFLGTSGSVYDLGDILRVSFAIDAAAPGYNSYDVVSSGYKYKMCNMLKHYFAYNDASAHWYRNTVLYLFFPKSLVGSTVTSVRDYLISIKDSNPLSFWLPYATPQTYQLTPTELKTLLGQNNIFCNTGDTTVKYWKWLPE